jgi:protein phosphatase
MGTTATIAGLLGDTLYLAQVGDSRAYLVRNGVPRQITKDQSLMQKLIEEGEITVEEAELSERRNIILQALGPEAVIRTDLTHQHVRRGDTLVLCSDGLSGQMRIDDIGRAIVEEPTLDAACSRLIALANANGGPDNITVVAARFEGEGLAPPASNDSVGHSVYPLGDEPTPHVPIGKFMASPPMVTSSPDGNSSRAMANMSAAQSETTVKRTPPIMLMLALVALAALAAVAAYRFVLE